MAVLDYKGTLEGFYGKIFRAICFLDCRQSADILSAICRKRPVTFVSASKEADRCNKIIKL